MSKAGTCTHGLDRFFAGVTEMVCSWADEVYCDMIKSSAPQRTNQMYPLYIYPWRTVLGLGRQVCFGGRRSFRADARVCLDRLTPPLQVYGAEHIPASGPALITANHYTRAGFGAWWIALAIASVVRAEMHWAITGELTFPGKWYAGVGGAGSRWLLRRISAVYGFTAMPPMPPRPGDVLRRARAVHRVLIYARQHPAAIIGLAPEGMDMPGGVLSWPPEGVGRFIALLADLGFRVSPVAAYEQDGAFCLHFGPAYALRLPAGLAVKHKDRAAAQIVMAAVAPLLPLRLRGEFA